jgi:hypothetical protein
MCNRCVPSHIFFHHPSQQVSYSCDPKCGNMVHSSILPLAHIPCVFLWRPGRAASRGA